VSIARRFVLCPACRRHAKAQETECPFCAASLAGQKAVGSPLDPNLARSRFARGSAALLASASAVFLLDCQTAELPPYGLRCDPDCRGSVIEGGSAPVDAGDAASEAGAPDATANAEASTDDAASESDAGDTSEAGDAATD
jgi:hypothetical protein